MGMKFSIEVSNENEKQIFCNICEKHGAPIVNISACYCNILIEIVTDRITAYMIDCEFSDAIEK